MSAKTITFDLDHVIEYGPITVELLSITERRCAVRINEEPRYELKRIKKAARDSQLSEQLRE